MEALNAMHTHTHTPSESASAQTTHKMTYNELLYAWHVFGREKCAPKEQELIKEHIAKRERTESTRQYLRKCLSVFLIPCLLLVEMFK